MRNHMIAIAGLAVLLVLGTAAWAQQGPPMEPPIGMIPFDDGDQAAMERREEVRRKVETVRILRLTESLKLDEKTAAKIAALFGSLDQQRKDAMLEGRGAMRDLREALKATPPDEKDLKALLEKIEAHHREMIALREKEAKELKAILTVEQQARYVLFQREFMREMRGMIRETRGGRGPGMHGGPGVGRRAGAGSRSDGPGGPPQE